METHQIAALGYLESLRLTEALETTEQPWQRSASCYHFCAQGLHWLRYRDESQFYCSNVPLTQRCPMCWNSNVCDSCARKCDKWKKYIYTFATSSFFFAFFTAAIHCYHQIDCNRWAMVLSQPHRDLSIKSLWTRSKIYFTSANAPLCI